MIHESYQGNERRHQSWHLDKKVPLALIFAFVMQTLTLVFIGASWKAETDQRLSTVEADILDNVEIRRRMWTDIKTQKDHVNELSNKITAVDERTKNIKDSVDRLLNLWLEDKTGR